MLRGIGNPGIGALRSSLRLLVCAFFVFAMLSGVSVAQEYRSTLAGTVTDAQQAVVPQVKVTVVQTETGARYEVVSGAEGQYTVPFLLPGTYSITAEVIGFKKYVRNGYTINANERKRLDISLEVGGTADSVSVTADAPLLTTATASMGQTIDARQVENMPISGRVPILLGGMAVGVMGPLGNLAAYDNGGASGFTMAGAPSQKNEILFNGTPNVSMDGDRTVTLLGYSPPMDAVAEVKVESFQADAAYGHTGGGTLNVISKGGTNAFHGTASEFNQATALAANRFFSNKSGTPKQISIFNQWGITAGGPVWVPRVLDGRNKLHFYFAYEGIYQNAPGGGYRSIPTAEQRNGDFSKLLALGANYQLYDPQTGVVEDTKIRRQPFAGNIIPANRISSIAKNVLGYYPTPNQPGDAQGQNNFFAWAGVGAISRYNNEYGRLDYNKSDRLKFMFNVRHGERNLTRLNDFQNEATGQTLKESNLGGSLDTVYILSASTFLDVRLDAQRNLEARTGSGDGFNITQLGFPASIAGSAPHAQFPGISISGMAALGSNPGGYRPFYNYQLFPTLTKVAGRHNLKFGADLREIRFSMFMWGWSTGNYSFDNAWTRGPYNNSPSAPTGQGMASFLLGLPSGGQFDVNTSQTSRNAYRAFFINDDIRVSKNLTLNVGLRSEYEVPTVERFNRSTRGLDFTSTSPISAAATAAYALNPLPELPVSQFQVRGGLLFAGPNARQLYQTHTNFSPRIGFAWTPPGLAKTVLRGGFGIFYAPNNLGGFGVDQPGFSVSTPLVSTQDGGLTPYATLANPFPAGLLPATGSSLGLATRLGQSVSGVHQDMVNGYSVRWNFNVQRELPGNMVLELAYIGNHGVHLSWTWPQDWQFNVQPKKYLSTQPIRDQASIDFLNGNVTNPFAGLVPGTTLNGSVVARRQLLKPFPQFTSVTDRIYPGGFSYFEAFDLRLEKRFSHGFQILGKYQFSKLLSATSWLNNVDPAPYKQTAWEDKPHHTVISASYELPLGRGKALGNTDNPVLSRILSGWSMNVIYTGSSGGVLSWGNVIYLGGDLKLRPHYVDGPAFDLTRFNRNSAQQLQDNYRTFPERFRNLRGDRVNNFDFSAFKTTLIREPLSLQYRCEFYNLVNHPTFGGPNLSPTSANFGLITGGGGNFRRIQMALRLMW